MGIPKGLEKCPQCGEYKGHVRAGDLTWEFPATAPDPETIISVTCLCDGALCPKCKKNKIHRPISNTYDEDTNSIMHAPYFGCMFSCSECKKAENSAE